MDTPTLYQQVLGPQFNRLPPVLQRFHGNRDGGRATGLVTVRRAAGLARYVAARALKLPEAGEAVALRLEVIPEHGGERWVRHFNGQCLETLQWAEGPHLIEKTGLLLLVFRLEADEQGLTFHLQQSRLWGMAVPRSRAMSVWARATAGGTVDHWRIEVKVGVPLLGTLTTYSGDIFPQAC